MHLTLTAYSTALFSTWCFVEEYGVLLDAGDGVSAGLLQKSRKVKHVFVSHADRDHVAGLLQLHQLNAREGMPSIYYPRDCGSFPALRAFVEKFDPQSGPATWRGLSAGEVVELGGKAFVRAEHSEHVETPGGNVKALRFILGVKKNVLRPEFAGLRGEEIVEMKKRLGPAAVTQEINEQLIGYSGDSPELDPAAWAGVQALIHECTFLDSKTAKRAHANLVDVLENCRPLSLQALVLIHFSSRYTGAEIGNAISQESRRLNLPFPVYAVIPGVVCTDVLANDPVWKPGSSQKF